MVYYEWLRPFIPWSPWGVQIIMGIRIELKDGAISGGSVSVADSLIKSITIYGEWLYEETTIKGTKETRIKLAGMT
jgi:hypothetical protein